MFARLLLLFTIIPILELCVLIPMGQKIGVWPTLAIIITTAVLGALLAKYQGASAWKRIKSQMASGQLPSDSILDGLAVLIASAFLFTPGILTDLSGFILLIPFTRAPIRRFAKKRLTTWLDKEQVGLFGAGLQPFETMEDPFTNTSGSYSNHGDVIIDVTANTAPKEHSQPEVITIGQDA